MTATHTIDLAAEERRANRTPVSTTAADIEAARALDAETHDGTGIGTHGDDAPLTLAEALAAQGWRTTDWPMWAKARLELQWELHNRRQGARQLIDAGEILRRSAIAVATTCRDLSDTEQDSLTGEVCRRVLVWHGPAPESRAVGIDMLRVIARRSFEREREASERAARADTDSSAHSWRDVADRSTIALDAPAGDGSESVGSVLGELARTDATFARRVTTDAVTDAETAAALGLSKRETDAWRAALAQWTGLESAVANGRTGDGNKDDEKNAVEAEKKHLQRGRADLRKRYPLPADLRDAWLEAQRAVAAERGSGAEDVARDDVLAADARAALAAIGRADHLARRPWLPDPAQVWTAQKRLSGYAARTLGWPTVQRLPRLLVGGPAALPMARPYRPTEQDRALVRRMNAHPLPCCSVHASTGKLHSSRCKAGHVVPLSPRTD